MLRCLSRWLMDRIVSPHAVYAGPLRPPIGHRSWTP